MVSIQRMFLASIILHLTVLLSGYWAIPTPRKRPKPVEAYQWLVDIGTVMLTHELGPSKDLSVQETAGGAPQTPDKPAAAPEGPGIDTDARAAIQTQSGERAEDAASPVDRAIAGVAAVGEGPREQGNPQLNQAFTNTMSGQMLMIKAGQFIRASNATVYAMLAQTLPVMELKRLDGTRGTVTVAFKDGGEIGSLVINTDNNSLREALQQKVSWQSIPLPRHYMLPYRKVTFDIFLAHEKITLRISPS